MIKTRFNEDWIFHMGAGGALQSLVGGGAGAEKNVTLPHDASVGRPRNPQEPNGSGNGFFREENYHYTKTFSLNPEDAGKNVWLEFEGIYQNAFLYVNNAFAGKCPYGYGNYYIDITKFICFEKPNHIKVIIKNEGASGRWYTGGGIYRDVNLMVADRLHLIPDGIHLRTMEADAEQAVIRAESTLEYTGTGVRDVALTIQLLDEKERVLAENVMPVTIQEHTKQTYRQTLYLAKPQFWGTEHPYLYRYRAFVTENGQMLDSETGTFGVRMLQLDRTHGLRLNGESIKLRGGCLHHDNGIIGTAEFPHAEEFRIRRLKEAGYNAIRSSHYPMSRRLLDACDKYGMLVMDEFADVWTTTKVDFDYGTRMSDCWEQDITNLVNKDYNHPCVILYSIGNEIPETGNKFDIQWGKKLADRIRALDDSRYVTNSLNLMLSIMDQLLELRTKSVQEPIPAENTEINSMMNSMGDLMTQLISSELAGKATEEAFAQVDVAGYNYAACRYEKDAIQYPNRIMVGSETYPQDLDVNWALVEAHPYLIGDFSWTAWDYLGEAGIGKISYGEATTDPAAGFYAAYPCKAAYCGDMNLLGDRRPISYWREIIWGLRSKPYLAVQLPAHHDEIARMTNWSMTNAVHSWTWNGYEGRPVTVEVYGIGTEVALYRNGTLLEKKPVGQEKKGRTLFETTYQPGVLEAVLFQDDREIGRDKLTTAGAELIMHAVPDIQTVPADGSDIAYLEIEMTDREGVRNTDAATTVQIELEGAGEILGFGSADPESEENYYDHAAVPYEGRLCAAIRGTGTPGKIHIRLAADGCEPVSVEMEAI